jgi:hypothetical protein
MTNYISYFSLLLTATTIYTLDPMWNFTMKLFSSKVDEKEEKKRQREIKMYEEIRGK